jgi:hypothetical protein
MERRVCRRDVYTHDSTSASCWSAFFAIVWNACSTLMASFAEVSKYGMFPFDWHHVIARFCVTCGDGNDQCKVYTTTDSVRSLVSCSPRHQSYSPEQQKGSSPGHVGLLGSRIHLASCPMSRMISSCSHHIRVRSNLHPGKKPHQVIGIALDQQCPTTKSVRELHQVQQHQLALVPTCMVTRRSSTMTSFVKL